MADERTTSFAKSVELDSYLDGMLDQIESPKEAFEMAAEGPPQSGQEREGSDRRESEMVSGDAAENNLRPPPEIAQPVDRATHQAEMRADHQGAVERNDELQGADLRESPLGQALHDEIDLEDTFKDIKENGLDAHLEKYADKYLDDIEKSYENGNQNQHEVNYNNDSFDLDRN